MYFKEWIIKFKDKDTQIGDLAYDIYSDKNFPQSNDKEKLLSHLRSCSACQEAINTFQNAWRKYCNR